jgi:manganese/zinc/iron transport system permease protein
MSTAFAISFGWDDPTARTVAVGLAALGAVAGALGTFAVVRRQSLMGDAISHAALPGIALAYLFGGRSPAVLVVGAIAAGWLAMSLVGGIVRRGRIPFDTALAGALAVFFGLGLLLMTYMQDLAARPPANALERLVFPIGTAPDLSTYLFGQAAFLRADQLNAIFLLGGGAVLLAVVFWKEFKLLSFDTDFAASLGFPTRALDLLLTTLIVAAVVVGLQAVGVVLMSALLVAPPVAARLWTDRLGRVAALAAVFGAAAGVFGEWLSRELGEPRRAVPTGPTVVIVATAVVAVSLPVAPWVRRRVTRTAPESA